MANCTMGRTRDEDITLVAGVLPQVMGAHVHEGNLGLYGMRERASLMGGTLTIESTPEEGTSIFAEIPLESEGGDHGKDPHSDSG